MTTNKNYPSINKFKDILIKTNINNKKRDKIFRKGIIYMVTHGRKDILKNKKKIYLAFNYILNS